MLRLLRFERQFPGSSFPTLVTATDGSRWLLKMQGAGNGLESLLAEFIVNRTAAKLNLCVPDANIMEIEEDFPWQFGTDEFDDILQKSFGANLAIQFIDAASDASGALAQNPTGGPIAQEADVSLRDQLFAIDIFFRNFDRTALSGNLLRDKTGKVWIIDHGSCRFLNRDAPVLSLPANHIYAGEPVTAGARHIIALLAATDFARDIIAEIPHAWFTATGRSADALQELLAARAGAFRKLI